MVDIAMQIQIMDVRFKAIPQKFATFSYRLHSFISRFTNNGMASEMSK